MGGCKLFMDGQGGSSSALRAPSPGGRRVLPCQSSINLLILAECLKAFGHGAVVAAAEVFEEGGIDRFADEFDAAIGHGEVATAGVGALETTDI